MTVSEAVAAAAKRASEQLNFLKGVAERKEAEKRAETAHKSNAVSETNDKPKN